MERYTGGLSSWDFWIIGTGFIDFINRLCVNIQDISVTLLFGLEQQYENKL